MRPFFGRVGLVAVAAVIAGGLAGCGSTPEDEVKATMLAFLQALSEGNGATALAMTTSSKDAFACDSMVQDGDGLKIGNPEVLSVQVAGTSATAAVGYDLFGHVNTTLSLQSRDDRWFVVLPETYRVVVEFDAPTVAVATIDWGLSADETDHTCDVPVRDGKVDVLALPGSYRVSFTDPTGIVERHDSIRVSVGDTLAPVQTEAVPDLNLGLIDNSASGEFFDTIVKCVGSAFQPADACPPGTEGALPLDDVWGPLGPRTPAIDRVWTDDEVTWRFSTAPVTLHLTRDGVSFYLDVTYSGHLELDDEGAVVAVVDA